MNRSDAFVPKAQWERRVAITRFIYADLMLNNPVDEIIKSSNTNYTFDDDQLKIVNYYSQNRSNIVKQLTKNLGKNWTWVRIPQVEKAILITAICEFNVNHLDRKIIIDQALVSTKHYANPNSAKYINAILDKVLK